MTNLLLFGILIINTLSFILVRDYLEDKKKKETDSNNILRKGLI
jgi:positive regulator of sigma E activity